VTADPHVIDVRHASHDQKSHGRGGGGGGRVPVDGLTGEGAYRAGSGGGNPLLSELAGGYVKSAGSIETANRLSDREKQAVADELNAQPYGRIFGDLGATNEALVNFGLPSATAAEVNEAGLPVGGSLPSIPLGVRMQISDVETQMNIRQKNTPPVNAFSSPDQVDAAAANRDSKEAVFQAVREFKGERETAGLPAVGDVKLLSARLEAATGVSPASALISNTNSAWALSSQSTVSVAAQLEVAAHRGDKTFKASTPNGSLTVPVSMGWIPSGHLNSAAALRNTLPTSFSAVREATQRQTASVMSKSGIEPTDLVTLYRGSGSSTISNVGGQNVSIKTNPLSSWSESKTVAASFGGSTITIDVPASQIYGVSTWSGNGSIIEREVVLYDSPTNFVDFAVTNRSENAVTINIDEAEHDWIKQVRMPGTEDADIRGAHTLADPHVIDVRHGSHNQKSHGRPAGFDVSRGGKGKVLKGLGPGEYFTTPEIDAAYASGKSSTGDVTTRHSYGRSNGMSREIISIGVSTDSDGQDVSESLFADGSEDVDLLALEALSEANEWLVPERSAVRHGGHSPQSVHGRRKGSATGGGFDSQAANSTIGDDGRRTYSAGRVSDVHDPFVSGQMAGVTPSANKTLTIMGGGSGAGKGTLLSTGLVKTDNAVKSDSDEAKAALPEYQARLKKGDTSAAAYAHEESSDMASRLVAESLAAGNDTILDGTGDSSIAKIEAKVAAGRASGARVIAEYATISKDEAFKRATDRAERTGRKVPAENIENTHNSVSDVVPQAVKLKLFDEIRVWDMTSTPRVIFEQKNGVDNVIDPGAWESFKNKGSQPSIVPRSDSVGAGENVVSGRIGDLLRGINDVPSGGDLRNLYDESVPRSAELGGLPRNGGLGLGESSPDLGGHPDAVVGANHGRDAITSPRMSVP